MGYRGVVDMAPGGRPARAISEGSGWYSVQEWTRGRFVRVGLVQVGTYPRETLADRIWEAHLAQRGAA